MLHFKTAEERFKVFSQNFSDVELSDFADEIVKAVKSPSEGSVKLDFLKKIPERHKGSVEEDIKTMVKDLRFFYHDVSKGFEEFRDAILGSSVDLDTISKALKKMLSSMNGHLNSLSGILLDSSFVEDFQKWVASISKMVNFIDASGNRVNWEKLRPEIKRFEKLLEEKDKAIRNPVVRYFSNAQKLKATREVSVLNTSDLEAIIVACRRENLVPEYLPEDIVSKLSSKNAFSARKLALRFSSELSVL